MLKRILSSFYLLSFISLFVACNNDALVINKLQEEIKEINFACYSYYPMAYEYEGKVTGIEVDIFRSMCEKLGVDLELKVYDEWTDAYASVDGTKKSALFTITYTEDRAEDLQMVGPMNRISCGLLSSSLYGKTINSLTEAKALSNIAAVRGWAETSVLEDLGFTNIKYFDDFDDAVEDVRQGGSDAFSGNLIGISEEYSFDEFKVIFTFFTSFTQLAFTEDVSTDVVFAFQEVLDEMLVSGESSYICSQFNRVNLVPYSKLQLFTEELPPFNMSNMFTDAESRGRLITEGSTVEMVNAIQEHLGITNSILPTYWFNAYSVVQYLPYSALFTMARTVERENLFQWVGPVARFNFGFSSLKSKNITLDSLSDVKKYRVTTVKGWASEGVLDDYGVTYTTVEDMTVVLNMLLNDEVDLLFINELSLPYYCKDLEIDLDRITYYNNIQLGESYECYIAFSPTTPVEYVEQWQTAFDALKAEGAISTIWHKWFGNMPMSP